MIGRLSSFALIPMIASALTAGADAAPEPARRVKLLSAHDVVGVKLTPNIRTVMLFPEQVQRAQAGNLLDYRSEVQGREVAVETRPWATPTNLFVQMDTLTVTVLMTPAESIEEADKTVIFEPPTRAPAPGDPADARRRSILGFINSIETSDRPSGTSWVDGSQHLRIETELVSWGHEEGVVKFRAVNHGQSAFALAVVGVEDVEGVDQTVAVEFVGRDAAGPIAPGETLRGAVLFRNASRLQSGFALRLQAQSGPSPQIWVPSGDDGPNKERKALMLAAGAGAAQLERGEESALVGAWDIGVKGHYGINRWLSAEGAFGRLMTGEADLGGVPREEAIYRVQIGARLYLSDEGWTPYVRVGLGGALVSQTDGEDSSLDIRGLVLAGVGVERWLGRSLFVGAEAGGEVQTGAVVFLAGAHVGVAWGGYPW